MRSWDNRSWFWDPWKGPQTYSRKGLAITLIVQGFRCLWNCERTLRNVMTIFIVDPVSNRMDWGYAMAMIPYGHWWRRHRRAFHQHFNMTMIHKYQDIQVREARAFLRRLLRSPDDFMHHAQQYVYDWDVSQVESLTVRLSAYLLPLSWISHTGFP